MGLHLIPGLTFCYPYLTVILSVTQCWLLEPDMKSVWSEEV